MDLLTLLRQTFHHPGFRANQEAVCRAATEGRDVLLVMPTGAGKSLCYQLPALARGGTALVISPLIALMDDQAAKLSALGLRVARIHSGLSREESRQACIDYLSGALHFLFIAPERLRVPGFPEMLARRKPALIAIDEAHCISAWGHDFRPDYRTLGDHLPALRPAPVIALTATATPTVQRDIVAQLQLHNPALFIHGFRRTNLAIEVVELSKPERSTFAANLLRSPETRPAIVYTPSRKACEDLAAELNHTFARQTAAPYHAGLDPATRERVQRAFQSGQLPVVVATIAFGMGIDKADVRTVIHTALPGSVEAYYQEIGRAGRDGLPSRTVLLHSYADRKMHEFFFERDYPPVSDLDRVARILPEDFTPAEPLAQAIKMAPDQFEKAVTKLIAQGAAQVDVAGNVRRTSKISVILSGARSAQSKDPERSSITTTPIDFQPHTGASNWRSGYEAQLAFRRAQLERMAAFAETPQCRMAALVQHFGDTADGLRPCGHCDFCSPESTTAQTFAAPTTEQGRHLRSILSALASAPSRSTGKLHTDLGLPIDRRAFDTLLDALARAGLITITSDSFTNAEGNVIAYKKAALTHEGRSDDALDLVGVLLPSSAGNSAASTSTRKKKQPRNDAAEPTLTPAQQKIADALRAWRKAEAARNGKPAFLVVSDKVITHIAAAEPSTLSGLLAVPGIGQDKADRFGAEILSICRGSRASAATTPAPNQTTHAPTQRTPAGSPKSHPPGPNAASVSKSALLTIPDSSQRTALLKGTASAVPSYESTRKAASAAEVTPLSHPANRLSKALEPAARRAHEPDRAKTRKRRKSRAAAPHATTARRQRPSHEAAERFTPSEPAETFHRPAHTADPNAALTPAQQALDQRLRDWRKAESARTGMPPFLVLGSSPLRNIVLNRPRTLPQLSAIQGLTPEAARAFGPSILEICNA